MMTLLLLIPLLLVTLLTVSRPQQLLEILLTIDSEFEGIKNEHTFSPLLVPIPEVLHHHPGGSDHVVHHLPALAGHLAQECCPHLQLQHTQAPGLVHGQQLVKLEP